MQPALSAGDRVHTLSGDPATVIRPNRLDPDKSIIWPDRWGHLPTNLSNGPGMCLRNDTLQRLPPTPPQTLGGLVAPNPSLTPNVQHNGPTKGVTR